MQKGLMMTITKEFKFDAAHNLVRYQGKCENLHGHTYKLKVTLKGVPDSESAMIIDFGILKQIVRDKIIARLDHQYINNIIEQSTAENIIRWIWNELQSDLNTERHELYEIALYETETSYITLRQND